jgi:hypothetical protein
LAFFVLGLHSIPLKRKLGDLAAADSRKSFNLTSISCVTSITAVESVGGG